MGKKLFGEQILWWVEAVIAIRVLLFSLPVLINKFLAKSFLYSDINDRYIVVLTAVAVLYLLVGIASISGFRCRKVIHYLAAVLTIGLTIGSLMILGGSAPVVGIYYFSPILFSSIIAVLVLILGRGKANA